MENSSKKSRWTAADYKLVSGYDDEDWARFKYFTGILGAALLGRTDNSIPGRMKELGQAISDRRGKAVHKWKDMSPKDKITALDCVNEELRVEGIKEMTDMKVMNWRMADTLRFRQRPQARGAGPSSSKSDTDKLDKSRANSPTTTLPHIREMLPSEFDCG